MIVCVPVRDDGQVDPRWGRARRAAVVEVSDGQILQWREHAVGWDRLHDETTEGGHHARVATFLRENQVDTVMVHHMGDGMQHMLDRMGISVRLGIGGEARQAVLAGGAGEPATGAHVAEGE
jgi:predicted Fe-Mo cluster-binding NifX family protein